MKLYLWSITCVTLAFGSLVHAADKPNIVVIMGETTSVGLRPVATTTG
ncbi:hypothetical protein EC9_39750 [Rosistilla ulvae]|uniref:Uncharacterized protein n=1 Tax=Rosistilla ulvae TaxID=1930277 RepID=A0A517M4I4_9BACT|nr:hypothetical protein EC9_39750 [Rosistilla ulvae]